MQVGRSVDVSNSFEILYETAHSKPVFDEAFLEKRLDQCASRSRTRITESAAIAAAAAALLSSRHQRSALPRTLAP